MNEQTPEQWLNDDCKDGICCICDNPIDTLDRHFRGECIRVAGEKV